MPRSPKKATASKGLYSVHPGVLMIHKWIEELPAKTGNSLPQWISLVQKQGPTGKKERVDWLKKKHGFGTNSAGWIAMRAQGPGDRGIEEDSPEEYLRAAEQYVEKMFAEKEALRPLYDELLRLGLGLGNDVKACPCTTIVPLYREHVFAQIKPTTRTRIDLGLALGDLKATGRLIDTGGFAKKDRITHRLPIASLADINKEVRDWLRRAYERDSSAGK
jgi:hypothetical protein